MLELKDVTLFVGAGEDVRPLLADITAGFPEGHFGAIIGPSGCGKSTLLKVITGIANGDEEGSIHWRGRDVSVEDFSPAEIGYVPQFGIAYEELTAAESVAYAMRLRVRGMHAAALAEGVDAVLDEVGMLEFRDRRVSVLSGGQRRRLALAMELVSKPAILLCDEVTSGLDPQSEDEIVRLLHGLSRSSGRVVLSVTHSLRHLDLYDSVLVLFEGVVAYHGPPEYLAHYFRTDDPQELFARLELRSAKEWAQSWRKHRHAFVDDSAKAESPRFDSEGAEQTEGEAAEEKVPEPADAEAVTPDRGAPGVVPGPGALSQFLTLFARRLKIFGRNRTQVALQLGLIFGFPVLVAIFAWNGLPAVRSLSMGLDLDVVQQLVEAKDFLVEATKVGSLVSGIVMFQVVLLTLMGANNSGREIAAERLIFEKEKLAGLNPLSYVASKAVFLGLLVLAQSIWMGLFVHFICGFPGDLPTQLVFLVLVNAAMTAVCLAVSSFLGSAEQASLVSIYLVGFQLPLSGAVLALPAFLGDAVRPFIAAYWSWSGVLQTLKGERYYDIVQMVVQTSLSPTGLCLWVLAFHVVIGLFAAAVGCQRRQLQ
ncbi:MAG: ATP-binding cassette domain-containing protein [Terrimicrobiaceae bacterium]|nr:ATP-binding cassette domain-containing protein [Terrimicrobiaceae bacterium]